MPRPPRLQAHDGIFHLTTRGNRGASIAVDNHDRACFLELLGAVVRVCGWRCHAYCLILLGQFAEQVERARAQLAAFVDDGLVAVVTAA